MNGIFPMLIKFFHLHNEVWSKPKISTIAYNYPKGTFIIWIKYLTFFISSYPEHTQPKFNVLKPQGDNFKITTVLKSMLTSFSPFFVIFKRFIHIHNSHCL